MIKLTELNDQSTHLRYYALPDERVVIIEVDDEGTEITVSTPSGKQIGHFEFKVLPEEDFYDDDPKNASTGDPAFKLMWMGLEATTENYRRCGIGETCLALHKEIFDLPIYASAFNAPDTGDGSHLINDGIPFVARMIKEGLIEDNDYEGQEDAE